VLNSAPDAEGPNGRAGLSRAQLLQARQATAGVVAKAEVCAYVGRIVRTTRDGPRADGRQLPRRDPPAPGGQGARPDEPPQHRHSDDVRRVCRPVLLHRLTLQPDAYFEGFTTDNMLTTVLERVEVPR
jgi:MoxR-like ATPase